MAYSTTIPIIAGLAVVGALTGVGIGRATIGEVNPAYYQSASSHFYSDLSPNRGSGSSTQPDLGSSDYLQADYAYSATPGCIDCANYPVEYKPVHEKSVDQDSEAWAAKLRREAETVEVETASAEPPPANREWIERYTTYSVAAEPVAAEPVAEVQQAATPEPPVTAQDIS